MISLSEDNAALGVMQLRDSHVFSLSGDTACLVSRGLRDSHVSPLSGDTASLVSRGLWDSHVSSLSVDTTSLVSCAVRDCHAFLRLPLGISQLWMSRGLRNSPTCFIWRYRSCSCHAACMQHSHSCFNFGTLQLWVLCSLRDSHACSHLGILQLLVYRHGLENKSPRIWGDFAALGVTQLKEQSRASSSGNITDLETRCLQDSHRCLHQFSALM